MCGGGGCDQRGYSLASRWGSRFSRRREAGAPPSRATGTSNEVFANSQIGYHYCSAGYSCRNFRLLFEKHRVCRSPGGPCRLRVITLCVSRARSVKMNMNASKRYLFGGGVVVVIVIVIGLIVGAIRPSKHAQAAPTIWQPCRLPLLTRLPESKRCDLSTFFESARPDSLTMCAGRKGCRANSPNGQSQESLGST